MKLGHNHHDSLLLFPFLPLSISISNVFPSEKKAIFLQIKFQVHQHLPEETKRKDIGLIFLFKLRFIDFFSSFLENR
jgi:hypothetical protein